LLSVAALSLGVTLMAGAFVVLTTDEQKGQAITEIASGVSPTFPEAVVFCAVRPTKRTAGASQPRKLAEATLLTEQFRAWPAAISSDLLEWYIRTFSEGENAQDVSIFASHLV
jgi:hypothetical protein